jgi:D-alanine-D-alanine ligase
VAVLHNLKSNAPSNGDRPDDALEELDAEVNVEAYCRALRSCGYEAVPLEGNLDLPRQLRRHRIDICFNTCEGYRGESRESQVPALLEMMGMPYTGGRIQCLANTLDKVATKRILLAAGLPTPAFQEFAHADQPLDPSLHWPLFVKPAREGTGIGIDGRSLVESEGQLRVRVSELLQAYREPVLVEEYVPGADVTCGLTGNLEGTWEGRPIPSFGDLPRSTGGGLDWGGVHIFPVSQIDHGRLSGMDPFYSHALKALPLSMFPYLCPAPLGQELSAEVMRLSVETFRLTRCLDFARVDFRLDERHGNQPQVIEINALPGLAPISDLVLCARAEGWSYENLLHSILKASLKRQALRDPSQASVKAGPSSP